MSIKRTFTILMKSDVKVLKCEKPYKYKVTKIFKLRTSGSPNLEVLQNESPGWCTPLQDSDLRTSW